MFSGSDWFIWVKTQVCIHVYNVPMSVHRYYLISFSGYENGIRMEKTCPLSSISHEFFQFKLCIFKHIMEEKVGCIGQFVTKYIMFYILGSFSL